MGRVEPKKLLPNSLTSMHILTSNSTVKDILRYGEYQILQVINTSILYWQAFLL